MWNARHCKPPLIFLSSCVFPTKRKKKHKNFIVMLSSSGECNWPLKFLFFLDSGKLDSIQEKILKVVSRPGNCMIQGTVNYKSCVAVVIFKGSVSLTGSWESQMSGILWLHLELAYPQQAWRPELVLLTRKLGGLGGSWGGWHTHSLGEEWGPERTVMYMGPAPAPDPHHCPDQTTQRSAVFTMSPRGMWGYVKVSRRLLRGWGRTGISFFCEVLGSITFG